MTIQESAEMYLETILVLSKQLKHVRAIDIARHMNFSKPSVSRAMKNLTSEGYINIDEQGHITLNSKGFEIANKIYERHQVLTKFFTSIGVPLKNAEDDACKIEHVISDETFEVLKKQIK